MVTINKSTSTGNQYFTYDLELNSFCFVNEGFPKYELNYTSDNFYYHFSSESVLSLKQVIDKKSWEKGNLKLSFNESIGGSIDVAVDWLDTHLVRFSILPAKADEADGIASQIRHISHDLQSPFKTILGLTSLINMEATVSDVKIESLLNYVNLISQRANTALEFIVEFLDIAKLQSGEVSFTLTDPIALIENFVKSNRLLSLSRKLNVEIDNQVKDKPFIYCNTNYLNRALGNIYSNAVKYSNEGGKIIFRIVSDENMVNIIVIDEGQGIDSEDKILLLTGGQTNGRTGTKGEQSHGFGYQIIRRVVEMHRGELSIFDNPEGKGTCVKIGLIKL